MLSGRKDRRELLETLRTKKNKLLHRSGRGKKKAFGFGGFSLTSSFHKAGELGSWQKERGDKGWSATKIQKQGIVYNNDYVLSRYPYM